MVSVANLHGALERLRAKAKAACGAGPRVMVVGPANVGKSTVARTLGSYSARTGGRPLYVDLDVGEGALGVPGVLSAVSVDMPVDVEGGFNSLQTVSYHYGHVTTKYATRLFHLLVSRMAAVCEQRVEQDPVIKSSGHIINCPELDKATTMHAQAELKADVLVVIDNERLYNELLAGLPGCSVVKLVKSGGVVPRDTQYCESARKVQIKRYFYGPPGAHQIHPHSFSVRFEDVKMYKIGAPPIPAACLPLGQDPKAHETQLVTVKFGPDLLHACLTVSTVQPDAPADMAMIEAEALGFVALQNIDFEERTLTILAPAPYENFPTPCTLLLSAQRFSDSSPA